MKNIGVVIYQFYKTTTRGGEYHANLLVNIIRSFARVTIITTQSKSHLYWNNELTHKHTDLYEDIHIKRFPIDFTIVPRQINNITRGLYENKIHSKEEEIAWMEKIGPYSTALFKYLRKSENYFDQFIFIGYSNPITYFGLPLVSNKSILIPLAHNEPFLYFHIFDEFFSLPNYIVTNTRAEKLLIKNRFANHAPIRQIGMCIPEHEIAKKSSLLQNKYKITFPYMVFIGRTEPNKGIFNLLDYFNQYVKKAKKPIHLVVVGEKIFPIKTNAFVHYVGVVDQTTKQLLVDNSLLLVNPSWYESLSLTLFDAWSARKPVLVNGWCNVLKDQVALSNGGLSYEDYMGFEKNLNLLINNRALRDELGNKGFSFYNKFFSKTIILSKIKRLLS